LDGARACGNGSSLISCASIGVTPNYDINSCSASYISTQGQTQATAIANIKNVLNQNKAVWFAFYAPTQAADTAFMNFWNNQSENVYLINFLDGQACGQTWSPTYGWGHAVLCYGYNDNDPNNSVWYMLNSWGTTPKRPRGTFYVDMDINYSCQRIEGGYYYYNYFWAAYDIDFNVTPAASTYRVLAKGDFDGDDYSDIAIFRPSTGMWAIRNLSTVYLGSSGDKPVPGAYVNGTKTEIAIFRESTGLWSVRGGNRCNFGSSGDQPVPGDYNSTWGDEIGIFRASSGYWSIRDTWTAYYGVAGDVGVTR